MMAARKPFKGCKEEELVGGVPFPCYCSFKIDGIRGLSYDEAAKSTSAKDLPNKYVQAYFEEVAEVAEGLDGELTAGNPYDPNVMQQTSSFVMSKANHVNDWSYWVFDDFTNEDMPFEKRIERYTARVEDLRHYCEQKQIPFRFKAVEQRYIENAEQYEAMKLEALELGYEGIYGHSVDGAYKQGRATPKQRWNWKWKPWTDDEAVIIGFVEMTTNNNEAFLDELGRIKRSTAKDGLVGNGHLGSYLVRSPKYGIDFAISCGNQTMEWRKKAWEERESVLFDIATFKFFNFGVVDAPRSAFYKAIRSAIDLDTDWAESLTTLQAHLRTNVL